MFLKKRHLEILKLMKDVSKREELKSKLPEEFEVRIAELFILGFIEISGGDITFTDVGRRMLELIDKIPIEEIPDVYINSEIIKIMELLDKTGYVPESWNSLLLERYLADSEGLTEVGKEILNIYRESHPVVYLTPDILNFVKGMPKIGLYDELITYKNTKKQGDNILNALQAMRLLSISPTTEAGKAFATTVALKEVLKIASMVPKLTRALILRKEDFDAMRRGDFSEEMVDSGFCEKGEITALGQSMLNTYSEIGKTYQEITPVYVLEEEITVLKTIEIIKEKYETNPEVLPTYKEIRKRSGIEDLGEILHTLEFKELIRREVIKNKDTYWMTEFGEKIKDLGTVTTDGMKAITYPEHNDTPIAEWVLKGKEENVVDRGITDKGSFLLKFTRSIKRKPYLTKYDISALINMPVKRYIHRDELVELIQKHVGGEEEAIIKALNEAESKGLIRELQNKMLILTELGEGVKKAVEMGKVQELLSTKFAITPTTFNILLAIYNNRKEFDRVWREKSEIGAHKENEIILLAKLLPLTIDEIKKSLVILKNVGLIGKKGLTDAGVKLVESYLNFWRGMNT
ncbi:MAG TPA: DUF505 domain-containing protein [Methanococcaceae archaeon]|uniref:DUF505 domain-containing protein n=1 Tax=Methanothermococcus okinawensis TaxID=155863 RepID=A0A832ZKD4_9EURY|nr:DUF505 domain-containing protein [Methanococcaceae archaeon]HIP91771.1 DUF505 domain-containing protein [Methanothermococcus okinawensis]